MTNVSQSQRDIVKQPYRNISLRVNLLNFDKQVIESVEGRVISGSITSDANSNMRNTCDIEMIVTGANFKVESGGKIWLDRFLQIYVGVDDLKTGETVWNNKGLFILNQPTYRYDAEANRLSFQGIDIMGLMTDIRGGQLTESYIVPAGTNVREVIISILGQNGFNEYDVSECMNSDGTIQEVPYDMVYDIGSTWWDILEGLQNILPNYQMYFDNNGVFHYEPIPYKQGEAIMITDDIWKENTISEEVSYDFESVKNSIKVLGRTHSVDYYGTIQRVNRTENACLIDLNVSSYTTPYEGVLIGFALPGNEYGRPIYIKAGEESGYKRLVRSDGVQISNLDGDEFWVITYNSSIADAYVFLGHIQATGESKDENPSSPYFIGNPAGEIKIVLYGGEFDNIVSDELAKERADWEIYQRCRLNDTINLTTVPIYWSEVNWMVSYTPLGQTTVNQYLINSITTDLTYDGTQTYNLVRWYPYYIQYSYAAGKAIVTLLTESGLTVRDSRPARSLVKSGVKSNAEAFSKRISIAGLSENVGLKIFTEATDAMAKPAASDISVIVSSEAEGTDAASVSTGYMGNMGLPIHAEANDAESRLAETFWSYNFDTNKSSATAAKSVVAQTYACLAKTKASAECVNNDSTVIASLKSILDIKSGCPRYSASESVQSACTVKAVALTEISASAANWEYPIKENGLLIITQAYDADKSVGLLIIE